jgi:predicted trehalose synthase
VVAETATHGRVEFKILRLLGPSYEDRVLRYLNERAPGLAPRLYCKVSIGGYPVVLVMEHVDGEPVTTRYLEAAVSTISTGTVVTVGDSERIGGMLALLHNTMLSCGHAWCKPERSSWSSFDSWVKRLQERS